MVKMDLSFCELEVIDTAIARVTVFYGVEVDKCHIEEYHQALNSLFQEPFALLIDQKNQYSYSYEAMSTIGSLDNLKAVAILAYSMKTIESMRVFGRVPRPVHLNMEFFFEQDQALNWLKSELLSNQEELLNSKH